MRRTELVSPEPGAKGAHGARIVQFVPRPGDESCGLTGYATAVGRALAVGHGIESETREARSLCDGAAWPFTETLRLRRAVAARATRDRPGAASPEGPSAPARAVLHYVNYGYEKRGCPLWLVSRIRQWREVNPGARLVTIFHEVYAFGPPWTSSFWLSPVQRWLARRLLALSDAALTSLSRYAVRLRPDAAQNVKVLPMFSNVGELEDPLPLAARAARLVVFGGPALRRRAWGSYRSALVRVCDRLGIEAVDDVGPLLPDVPPSLGGRAVDVHGPLPAVAVSELFARARAGFVAYPTPFLAKSTVFAGYAAHGLLPVVAWEGGETISDGDGPVPHLRLAVDGSGPPVDSGQAEAVAREAHRWYSGHAVAAHADWLAAELAR